jgi:hypothetical protein
MTAAPREKCLAPIAVFKNIPGSRQRFLIIISKGCDVKSGILSEFFGFEARRRQERRADWFFRNWPVHSTRGYCLMTEERMRAFMRLLSVMIFIIAFAFSLSTQAGNKSGGGGSGKVSFAGATPSHAVVGNGSNGTPIAPSVRKSGGQGRVLSGKVY